MRKKVTKRAKHRCEYCLLPQSVALHKNEVDHIIPTQHGGKTEENNLALSCMRCNRYKGSNVGSFDPITGELTQFFNPRVHKWSDHFIIEKGFIQPLTPEGRVTISIFNINQNERVSERKRLLQSGSY
ncbi:HNH endonuclease [Tunicatimonas pelagia]|uniref:HNH endonuclease n=1 Tax=Tunicatimonas pelagia TaxID=931531 RepID=UPI00266705D8|nr:HNH endonuclease [Tunicatimonas pelagia]WKN45824.1 HNH endonuclease [Tunicatimonas pelagia]